MYTSNISTKKKLESVTKLMKKFPSFRLPFFYSSQYKTLVLVHHAFHHGKLRYLADLIKSKVILRSSRNTQINIYEVISLVLFIDSPFQLPRLQYGTN